MDNLLVAMIPVDHEMAIKKRWGRMPLDDLVKVLQTKTAGAVIQSDKAAPSVVNIDLNVDPLFYEVLF
jgi:hypothetical protein